MKILVLGSTGFIGTAITDRLVASGHHVVGVVRNSDSRHPRAEARRGDLGVPASLQAAVTPDIDVVIHAATPLGDWEVERESVRAMLDSLGHAPKVFLYVSGTWVLGPGAGGAAFDEVSTLNPIALVDGRESVEALVLESSVTGIVLRPGIAFGRGGGIPGLLVDWARETGKGWYVGSADTTWPVVHVEDLARLVELAITESSGGILHGVGQGAVRVPEIAAAADQAAGGDGVAVSWAEDEAAVALGAEFAQALATSQTVGSDRARALGWAPEHTDIVGELARGSYAAIRQGA